MLHHKETKAKVENCEAVSLQGTGAGGRGHNSRVGITPGQGAPPLGPAQPRGLHCSGKLYKYDLDEYHTSFMCTEEGKGVTAFIRWCLHL